MPTTDEELQQKQENVAKLRQQVADANAKREINVKELSNDFIAQQLDVEQARLEIQLAEALANSTAKAAKAGAADLLQNSKDEMAAAVAQQKAAEEAAGSGSTDSGN